MSEQTSSSSRSGRGRRALIYLCCVAAGLLLGLNAYITVRGITELDRRIGLAETQLSSPVAAIAVSELQAEVTVLRDGLSKTQQRITEIQNQSAQEDREALRQSVAVLRETQQTQENQLNVLTDQLNSLKAKPAMPIVETPAVVKPAVPINKSVSANTRSKDLAPVARKAPFVLTGVERRGTASWAAIAPRGYGSLSQIALVGVGEAVSGWTFVRAGHNEATFQVSGHPVVLRVE